MAVDVPASTVDGLDRHDGTVAVEREACVERRAELVYGQPRVEVHEVETADLVFAQPPQVFGARVPKAYCAVRADDDDGTTEAREDRAEEPVELVDFVA